MRACCEAGGVEGRRGGYCRSCNLLSRCGTGRRVLPTPAAPALVPVQAFLRPCNDIFWLTMACRYSTLSYAAYKKSASGFSDGRAYLTNMFKQAQQLGFNTYRFFIQGDFSYLTTAAGTFRGGVLHPRVDLRACMSMLVVGGPPCTQLGGTRRHAWMAWGYGPEGGVMEGDQRSPVIAGSEGSLRSKRGGGGN